MNGIRRATRSAQVLVLLMGGTLATVTDSAAQQATPWRPPAGLGEVTFLGANTLLGGLTAGILQAVRGGSFSDGFTRGALGGAIVYGGKRLSVGRFAGAGFIGREAAAVGTSMVRNASQGEPLLSSLVLPVGPVWLYTGPDRRLRVKPDLRQLIWLGYAVSEPALLFQFGKTLSAGAPVFLARNRKIQSDGETVFGVTGGSMIMLSSRGVPDPERTFAHERVHVLQSDFYTQAWAVPAETWLLDAIGLTTVAQYVDLGLVTALYLNAWHALFGRANSFEQLEAEFLELR